MLAAALGGTGVFVTVLALLLYGVAADECRPFKEPENGSIKYSINGETIYAQLQCNVGYVTSSCAVTECRYGKWSHNTPHCRAAVECKELHHPLNGRVEFPVPIVYQSEAVYTCDMGYNLVGNSSRYCLDDGVWGGTEPSCVAVNCKVLTHPPNGRVELPVPVVYQSEAVYNCDAGYSLKGPSSRECLQDGVWSGTEPTCIAATKKINCGTPAGIKAGSTKFDATTLHSKVFYRCKNPRCHSLKGDSVATCTREGKWSNRGILPKCIKKYFNPKKFELPGELRLKNKKAVQCGGQVTAHCPSGYEHIGAKHGTVVSRHEIKWKGKTPTCVSD